MHVKEIAEALPRLKKKSQKRFFENIFILFEQLTSSVILRGPYRLVVDSNIIMRLESYQNGKITEGALSIFLFFEFLKRSSFSCDIVIRPSVFYEFVRQKNFTSVRQHWNDFKMLSDTIRNELDLIPFFDGIETFHNANHYLELIEHDVELITKELQEYKNRDWKFDFIRRPGCFNGAVIDDQLIEVPPFFAAQGLYKELGMKYFDEGQAQRFLIDHMSKHISEHPDNDKRIIDKYKGENEFLLTKILKLTAKGNLSGIADIDILTLCNVQTQFNQQSHGRYYPASIGLSIDSNLASALSYFSGIRLNSGEMTGGMEYKDSNSAKMEAFIHDQERVHEGDERMKRISEEQKQFFEEISSDLLSHLETA